MCSMNAEKGSRPGARDCTYVKKENHYSGKGLVMEQGRGGSWFETATLSSKKRNAVGVTLVKLLPVQPAAV